MAWAIEFYEDEARKRPVEEFFECLPEEHVGKILQVLQMLEEWGRVSLSPIRVRLRGVSASCEFATGARSTEFSITEMHNGPLCCCTRSKNDLRHSRKPSFRWQ